jgi:NAD(P)-dependent dehydrogenase (short-subunit alcohol dehydrogenase family)
MSATIRTPSPTTSTSSNASAKIRIKHLARQLLPQPTTSSTNAPTNVLITGVTSGIGYALSLEMARLGHNVIGCGRRVSRLKKLERELASLSNPLSNQHILHHCDVSDEDSVHEFANYVLNIKNVIPDIVFANAGISVKPGPLWEVSTKDFKHIFEVNVLGVFYILKAFIPSVLKASRTKGAKYKRILATSSGLGHSTSPILGPYSATKFSIESLMKSVAQSFANESNIGCWPLAPGVIQSEMMRNEDMPSAFDWAKDAAPFILKLGSMETPSGSSVSVPGYYSDKYMETWILKNGQELPPSVVAPFVPKKKE